MAAQEPSPPSSLEGNKPGFPKKILANNLEDKHLCNSCQKILRRPLQAQCGHRFCSFCFYKLVSDGALRGISVASHEGSCDFMIIMCPSCKELMRANEEERHNERECPERTLNCKYCKEPFLLKNIKVRIFSSV
ncbi:hypothetical protein XENOCAPTIV_008288 [Xenoophorus captivus]|uniref:Uncharacterized protein n=1 Tax=Xenoophorus captivus TaxID=1517983 RepID=A0ABV0QRI6_9TELE